MFQVAFDFDFKEFQRNIQQYQRTKTKPYHFTPQERAAITQACGRMARASAQAVLPLPDPIRDKLMADYFHAHSHLDRQEVLRNLRTLNDMIQDGGRKVTFVDGKGRHLHITMNPDNIDQYPTWRATPATTREMAGAEAWVHPLPGGAPRHGTHHVGSGIRIILGAAWSHVTTLRGRAATIYHELTHKLLGTNDHRYGAYACKLLPKNMQLRNADNYCCFIDDYMRLKMIA